MKKKKKQIAKCQVLTNWTTRSELGRIKQIEFCGWRKLAQKKSHLFWRCHSFQRVNPNSILINLLLPAITPLRIQKKNEHKLSMGFSFFFIKTHKFCYGSVKIMWAVGVTSLGVDFFFFFALEYLLYKVLDDKFIWPDVASGSIYNTSSFSMQQSKVIGCDYIVLSSFYNHLFAQLHNSRYLENVLRQMGRRTILFYLIIDLFVRLWISDRINVDVFYRLTIEVLINNKMYFMKDFSFFFSF